MIRNGFRKARPEPEQDSQGFDAFELRLGDLMRGERATMGKSLLDVQRELRIKAAYIAAIENADPSAFDTPGFIAGYVRSYARYLNLDPEWAFDTFCRESGFATAHGMSSEASGMKPKDRPLPSAEKDIFAAPATPFIPAREAMFSQIEPRAIGSVAVLIALIGGLGYGGWTVLQEVQKVQVAPVEATPTVLADFDPLAGAGRPREGAAMAGVEAPAPEALDRLYRSPALDRPVMVARDAPIATLDPRTIGALAPDIGDVIAGGLQGGTPGIDALPGEAPATSVQVREDLPPGVQLVAVRPAWVRVRAADGTVIFETVMNKGDTFDVPLTEEPATLRIGESGAVYFRVNGEHYGPVGPRGAVSSNVALSVDNLTETYAVAQIDADSDLAEVVQVAELQGVAQPEAQADQ